MSAIVPRIQQGDISMRIVRFVLVTLTVVAVSLMAVPGLWNQIPKVLAWNFESSTQAICTEANEVAVQITVTSGESQLMELWYGGSKIADIPAQGSGTGLVPLRVQSTVGGSLQLSLKWQGGSGDHPFSVAYDAKDCIPPAPSPECSLNVTGQNGNDVSVAGSYAHANDWGSTLNWGDSTSVSFPGSEGNIAETHTYAGPGNYNLSLVVNGPGGTASCSASVVIEEPPLPGEPVCSLNITVNDKFAISATGSYANANDWGSTLNWGDTSSVSFPGTDGNFAETHTYAGPGNYDLSLVVNGPGGQAICRATFNPERPEKPKEPTWQPGAGQCDFVVGSDAGTYSIDWIAGDGSIGGVSQSGNVDNGKVTVMFTNPGKYRLVASNGYQVVFGMPGCIVAAEAAQQAATAPKPRLIVADTGFPAQSYYSQAQTTSGEFVIPEWGFRLPIVTIEPVDDRLNPYGGYVGRYRNALLIHQFDAPSLIYMRIGQKVEIDGVEYGVVNISQPMAKPEASDFVGSNPDRMYIVTCDSTWQKNIVIEIAMSGQVHAEATDSPSSEIVAHVNTNGQNLNVRSGAGLNYDVIDTLANGTELVVLEVEGDWAKVQLVDGTVGFVANWLLAY